jgi:KipI family sensor histidine kinase inhibitor
MKVVPASDSSLLVMLGDVMSLDNHERVMSLFRALHRLNDPRIRNLHPAYASVLIDFDPLRLSHEEAASLVENLAGEKSSQHDLAPNIVTIPVCYDIEFGPDLQEVANHAKIPTREVIRLHSSAKYPVHFLGFTPGFAYLGGLPEVLHVPRLATPRKRVPAGSVAIAGSQAGIYPVDSPGGWRLIGRTPVRIFDPDATQPTRLEPGDLVEFSEIDRDTFDASVHRVR